MVQRAGEGSLWGFWVSLFGWEVAAIFLAEVGGPRLLSAPSGVYWAQISMRSLSMRFEYFRAREATMGE